MASVGTVCGGRAAHHGPIGASHNHAAGRRGIPARRFCLQRRTRTRAMRASQRWGGAPSLLSHGVPIKGGDLPARRSSSDGGTGLPPQGSSTGTQAPGPRAPTVLWRHFPAGGNFIRLAPSEKHFTNVPSRRILATGIRRGTRSRRPGDRDF
eukprot:TRINITY_DN10979_c0_g1_i1.p2 TRINITY_DN10979_c0_g1~~TRINITY_DN10979_c0_g1_i1.p2  ORF type:complete len:152 (+),score=9.12 TRINITY_DN10979_c0_g1_i1:174-629(+)